MSEPSEPQVRVLEADVVVGRYLIDGQIGRRGRFGITYRARDAESGAPVVLKEFFPDEFAIREGNNLRPRSEDDRRVLQFGLNSFIDQANGMMRLTHPNLASVLGVVEANDTAYYAAVPVDGEKLSTRLVREPRLAREMLPALIASLADALRLVHAAGLMHWDVRPENIRFDAEGRPVLTDFGAARHVMRFKCKSIARAVAPSFAAPEVYSMTGRFGPWTDIYALAAVAYTCVDAMPPPDALLRLRKTVKTLPAAIAAIGRYPNPFLIAVDWGLRLESAQRPQQVAEWIEALNGRATPPQMPIDEDSPATAATPVIPDAVFETGEQFFPDAASSTPGQKIIKVAALLSIFAVIALVLGFWMGRSQPRPTPASGTSIASPPPSAEAHDSPVEAAPVHPSAAAPSDALGQLAQELSNRKPAELPRASLPVPAANDRPTVKDTNAETEERNRLLKSAQDEQVRQKAELDAAVREKEDLEQRLHAAEQAALASKSSSAANSSADTSAHPPKAEAGFPPGYLNSVLAAINAQLHYPPKLLADGQTGTAIVHLKMARDGSVLEVNLKQRAGVPLMDEEAKNVVWRVRKFPAVPANIYPSKDDFDFDLPVTFTLAD